MKEEYIQCWKGWFMNCNHEWKPCFHEGEGSEGSHEKCCLISPFVHLTHSVCAPCGLVRWNDADGTSVKILEK